MQEHTYKIGGKAYPVTGCRAIEGVGTFPVVDIPLVSDYKWHVDCLKDRIEHPERYADTEDVAAVIENIKMYLEANRKTGEDEGTVRYEKA